MSVERGARVLCEYLMLDPDDPVRIVSDRGEVRMGRRWEDFAAIARAVLAAMREPTEAQLHAARDWAIQKYGRPIGDDGARGCFLAMIDEALK